ncbi:MAG: Type III pantothenate kinase [Lentisphaerae bacterium ADurb.Bin242]|nr:MAG: Type III pantothenate kinase [Lentisphaerae bacterium ADurb.Bin242]
MNARIRILNIGNTNVQMIDSSSDTEFKALPSVRTEVFSRDPLSWLKDCEEFAASSVVPELTCFLRSRGGFVVSSGNPLPFAKSKLDLTTVGADRLANAAALLDGPLPALSIDFGTAVTFEYVTGDRQFTGGAILPGRALVRHALHDYTAQLPLVDLYGELPSVPGCNTPDAIRLGTDLAAIGSVKELIGAMRNLSSRPLRIVACGGDRAFFLRHLEGLEDGSDFFTARGIRKLWEYDHACKNLRNQK